MERAHIGRPSGSPVDCLGELIADSEHHGLTLVRRLADEWISGANRFDRPGEALFVATVGGRAVGVCGLNVDPYAGHPTTGRVRHLYVLSRYRRLGIGQELVAAIVDAAHGRFESLRLRTNNPAAALLYERLGFRRRVDVADCTHVMELPSGHRAHA